MKKAIHILTGILLIAAFSLASTAFAWATTTKELLYIPLFILTLAGFIISLNTKKTGFVVILVASVLWLTKLFEEFGWFIVFKLNNLALWGLILLPVILSITLIFLSVKVLIPESKNKRKYEVLSLAIGLTIPIASLLSFADKTNNQSVFAEFYQLENQTYKAYFKATPSDTRMFEVKLNSEEVRKLVLNKATYVANHHYFPNAMFRVRMNFDKVKEVELYKLDGNKLEEPIKWNVRDLKGETEFLK